MRRSVSGCLIMAMIFGAVVQSRSADLIIKPGIDYPLIASAAVLSGAIELITNEPFAPSGFIPNADNINFIDREFAGIHNRSLNTFANITLAAEFILPSVVFALGLPDDDKLIDDMVVLAEAVTVNFMLLQLIKTAVSRPRPLLYNENTREEERADPDNYLSFYSGHTTASFGFATAITLLSYRSEIPLSLKRGIAIFSYSLATAVGALRLASGKHFPTDVLTGAIISSAVSAIIVQVHLREEKTVSLDWAGSSLNLSLRF